MAIWSTKEIAGLASMAGFSGEDLAIAVAVSRAENRTGNDQATHKNADGSIDVGLWQMNNRYWGTVEALKSPTENAKQAKKASSSGRGWSNWTQYRNGAYRSFLAEARKAAQDPDAEGALKKMTFTGGFWGEAPSLDQITDVPGAILSGVNAVIDTVNNVASWLGDPHNWARIAYAVAGGALALVAASIFLQPGIEPAVGTATKAAKKAVTKGLA